MNVEARAPAPPTSGDAPASVAPAPMHTGGIRWVVADAMMLTWRAYVQTKRMPELIVFSTIQPIMFVILFSQVFGGAISTPGLSYIDFLMPGIFVQTVTFGALLTGIGLTEDLKRGIIDRFRSLPMSRSAVLAGRTLSDLLRNIFVVLLMLIVGALLGFRFHGGAANAVLALLLMLVYSFSFSWISALIGLLVRNPETAQAAGFIWVFPLTFASSAFVPIDRMPGWLKAFAQVNPFTITVDAVRSLCGAGPVDTGRVLLSLTWTAGLLVVFVPLAVWQYRRTT